MLSMCNIAEISLDGHFTDQKYIKDSSSRLCEVKKWQIVNMREVRQLQRQIDTGSIKDVRGQYRKRKNTNHEDRYPLWMTESNHFCLRQMVWQYPFLSENRLRQRQLTRLAGLQNLVNTHIIAGAYRPLTRACVYRRYNQV